MFDLEQAIYIIWLILVALEFERFPRAQDENDVSILVHLLLLSIMINLFELLIHFIFHLVQLSI
jgi:hypothetical protein